MEKTLVRDSVCEVGLCSCVSGVSLGVTAGNQAGTDLVSRGDVGGAT